MKRTKKIKKVDGRTTRAGRKSGKAHLKQAPLCKYVMELLDYLEFGDQPASDSNFIELQDRAQEAVKYVMLLLEPTLFNYKTVKINEGASSVHFKLQDLRKRIIDDYERELSRAVKNGDVTFFRFFTDTMNSYFKFLKQPLHRTARLLLEYRLCADGKTIPYSTGNFRDFWKTKSSAPLPHKDTLRNAANKLNECSEKNGWRLQFKLNPSEPGAPEKPVRALPSVQNDFEPIVNTAPLSEEENQSFELFLNCQSDLELQKRRANEILEKQKMRERWEKRSNADKRMALIRWNAPPTF